MGRPKEFDRDQALDRALELFWSRGYEATSMSDLVEHLGIGRQSLYDTFGDKHALYLAALDRYRTEHSTTPWHLLDQPLRKGLRALMLAVVDWLATNPDGKICMMVGAAAERCPQDPEVAARFCTSTRDQEARLAARLRRAVDDGEIGAHHDPEAVARYLINTLYGLQLSARTTRDRAALAQIVDVALSILG